MKSTFTTAGLAARIAIAQNAAELDIYSTPH